MVAGMEGAGSSGMGQYLSIQGGGPCLDTVISGVFRAGGSWD